MSIRLGNTLISGNATSGFEIGDIGIAPLGIDETKGKRRYLNGQILIQERYKAFTNKLKNSVALYPSLACTEEEWQTTTTMTVGGQVGKFVIDDEAGTIRLPKIIMPIQGLTDLSKLAEIVEAGLPNITAEVGHIQFMGIKNPTGAFSISAESSKNSAYDGNTDAPRVLKFNASKSNSIYGNSTTAQQEQIQYPYFIQVATGAETVDNITNERELINPYVLLEPKYFETEVYNLSWLRANGSFNGSSAVHPSVYNALLIELNADIEVGTTQNNYTKRGLPVKLATDSYTDYDFVVNPADETFRLPTKVKLASGKAVVGNGMTLGLTNGQENFGVTRLGTTDASRYQPMFNLGAYDKQIGEAITGGSGISATTNVLGVGVTTDPTKSGIETSDSGLYLYFYVGETVQNANLINAGRIEEIKANRTEVDGEWVIINWIELFNGTLTTTGTVLDLSSILPTDDSYKLLLEFNVPKASATGGGGMLNENNIYIFSVSANTTLATKGHVEVPYNGYLKLVKYNGTDFSFSVGLRGYKRLGKKGA